MNWVFKDYVAFSGILSGAVFLILNVFAIFKVARNFLWPKNYRGMFITIQLALQFQTLCTIGIGILVFLNAIDVNFVKDQLTKDSLNYLRLGQLSFNGCIRMSIILLVLERTYATWHYGNAQAHSRIVPFPCVMVTAVLYGFSLRILFVVFKIDNMIYVVTNTFVDLFILFITTYLWYMNSKMRKDSRSLRTRLDAKFQLSQNIQLTGILLPFLIIFLVLNTIKNSIYIYTVINDVTGMIQNYAVYGSAHYIYVIFNLHLLTFHKKSKYLNVVNKLIKRHLAFIPRDVNLNSQVKSNEIAISFIKTNESGPVILNSNGQRINTLLNPDQHFKMLARSWDSRSIIQKFKR
uniref:G protein-coupled receptor n=1 Tax=Rhabditophanes sp. KR3021 TaxID=114890 RepID=A0AC35U1Q4_9BILA